MIDRSLKEVTEAYTKLTETLQDCIISQDTQGAVELAKERHDALVSILENSEVEQSDKVACVQTMLAHLCNEHILAKSNAHQTRSKFIARKSALRAYTLKAA